MLLPPYQYGVIFPALLHPQLAWPSGYLERAFFLVTIVLGNVTGLVANTTAAFYFQMAAQYTYTTANGMQRSVQNEKAGRHYNQLAGFIASVQSFSEVAVLLLVIIAFVAAGIVSARLFNAALAVLDNAGPDLAADMKLRGSTVGAAKTLGKRRRRDVVVTTGFVFVAFLLRAIVSTMLALANQLGEDNTSCTEVISKCDASCFNVFTHIGQWSSYTPEFQVTVVLISSPLALLVALWGMTCPSHAEAHEGEAAGYGAVERPKATTRHIYMIALARMPVRHCRF